MANHKATARTIKALKRLKGEVRSSVFVEADYLKRLRLMREMVGGDQTAFAKSLGIPFKRWSNYERGYPIPRDTAWLLWDRLGISVEWLWYGATGNMTPELLRQLEATEKTRGEQLEAEKELERAKAKLKAITERRKARPVPERNS